LILIDQALLFLGHLGQSCSWSKMLTTASLNRL